VLGSILTVSAAEKEVNVEAGVSDDNSSPVDVTLLDSEDASFAAVAAIVLSTGGSSFRVTSVNSTRLMQNYFILQLIT